MQKILKWFTPLLAVGVAIFIIFFLISINSTEQIDNSEPLEFKDKVVVRKKEKIWLEHFSKSQRLGYLYPVQEVFVKMDLGQKIVIRTIYKLSAPILDPYQLFCLKEELKNHNLHPYLIKDKHSVELLIYSKSLKKLNLLVRVLKNYQIMATIKPYKKEEI